MGIKRLFGLCISMLWFSHSGVASAVEIPSCSENYQREVKERIIEPASFVDILSDRVVVTEGTELMTLPAEWGWVDKPSEYVRPQFIEMSEIHVGSFGWSAAEVEVSYQAESHDVLKRLDGTTQRRVVPAIKKKVTKRFQEYPNTYFIRKTKVPFDVDTMETTTKIKTQTKPSLSIDKQVEFLPKYVTDRFDFEHKPIPPVTKTLIEPNVVGRIRYPATIEEYLGDCVKTNP